MEPAWPRADVQRSEAGRLHVLRPRFRMKPADPFSALLNANTSAVVRAGNILAVSGRLHLRRVGHNSHLRTWEDPSRLTTSNPADRSLPSRQAQCPTSSFLPAR